MIPCKKVAVVLAVLVTATTPANAAILNATGATLRTVFAAAQSGDTIKVTGNVGSLQLQNRLFTRPVILDATYATFSDSLTISGVSNLTIRNGTFGSWTEPMRTSAAIGVYSSSNVLITKSKFIGNGTGVAIRMSAVTKSAISAALVNGFKAGIGLTSVTDTRINSSRFVNMTSDGINIADSHRIEATTNHCYGSKPTLGAHPDCIQMWSIAGNPMISDITLSKNVISGDTQGIALFDGGGIRIKVLDNTINTSFPQGIACYDCYDSVISGNMLTTIPGSRWRTSINVVRGANNLVTNNSVGPKTVLAGTELGMEGLDEEPVFDHKTIPDWMMEDYLIGQEQGFLADEAGVTDFPAPDELFSAQGSAAAVPEPAVWAQLLLGFATIGFAVRARARRAGAAIVHA